MINNLVILFYIENIYKKIYLYIFDLYKKFYY